MISFESNNKWIKAHLQVARTYGNLSHAKRLQVGSILVKDNRVVSIGINGTPSGWSNTCEDRNGDTRPEVIHAEINSILFAAKNGIPTTDCVLVTTDSPCMECAKAIIQAGIKTVYYGKEYRDKTGLRFLSKAKILTIKVEE